MKAGRKLGKIVFTVLIAVAIVMATAAPVTAADGLSILAERIEELESKVRVLELRVNALNRRLSLGSENTLESSTDSTISHRKAVPRAPRKSVEDNPMAKKRFSWMRIDDQWYELPYFDLRYPSSRGKENRSFKPSGMYYYRAPGATSDYSRSFRTPLRAPPAYRSAIPPTGGLINQTLPVLVPNPPWKYQGWHDVTVQVNRKNKKEWEEKERRRKETIPSYREGEFGKLSSGTSVRLNQVIAGRALIVHIDPPGSNDIDMWLQGFDVSGLTDDIALRLPAIAIIGTKTYTTVMGASKTVLLAVPLKTVQRGLSDNDLQDLAEYLAVNR